MFPLWGGRGLSDLKLHNSRSQTWPIGKGWWLNEDFSIRWNSLGDTIGLYPILIGPFLIQPITSRFKKSFPFHSKVFHLFGAKGEVSLLGLEGIHSLSLEVGEQLRKGFGPPQGLPQLGSKLFPTFCYP